MKRFGTALFVFVRRRVFAVAPLAALVIAGCNDYGNTFQNPNGAVISFISPTSITAGGPSFTLTVNSSNGGFVQKTVVQWNGKSLPTTFVSTVEVTAEVSASLIANPGTAYVNTLNPHSG